MKLLEDINGTVTKQRVRGLPNIIALILSHDLSAFSLNTLAFGWLDI